MSMRNWAFRRTTCLPSVMPALSERAHLGQRGGSPVPRDLLAGIRIADLTHFWSGPHCTSLLGAMGAEVIKIESPQRPDGFRLITPINLADDHWYEQAGMWNSVNTNKRGITLELRSEIGRQVFLSIIEKSDVLIDNFSPLVMKNFGFEYEKLKEINPRLV